MCRVHEVCEEMKLVRETITWKGHVSVRCTFLGNCGLYLQDRTAVFSQQVDLVYDDKADRLDVVSRLPVYQFNYIF